MKLDNSSIKRFVFMKRNKKLLGKDALQGLECIYFNLSSVASIVSRPMVDLVDARGRRGRYTSHHVTVVYLNIFVFI